jgi:hypothetical protein
VNTCACRCWCTRARHPDCDTLCETCWREWCQGSQKHAPRADSSYMGTYGLTNIWTGWLISQAPELAAQTPAALRTPEVTPRCPSPCGWRMIRRPGAWKCYQHDPPVVIPDKLHLPHSPAITVIGV